MSKLNIPDTRIVTLENTIDQVNTAEELEGALIGIEMGCVALPSVKIAVRDKEGKLVTGVTLELWKTEEDEYIVEISGRKEGQLDGSGKKQ